MPGAIRPAPEVLLRHGPHAVTLRASLGALIALDRYPGSFGALVAQIARQSITALHFAVRATATDRAGAEQLLAYAARNPLAPFAGQAQAACLALLAGIFNSDRGEAPSASSAPSRPFADDASELYRIATGWLGWTPAETWNASPDEIMAAYEGHVDRLVMLTPGATKPEAQPIDEAQRQANVEEGLDPDFDRAGLHALKSKHHL